MKINHDEEKAQGLEEVLEMIGGGGERKQLRTLEAEENSTTFVLKHRTSMWGT